MEVKLLPMDVILAKRNLQKGGKVQKFIDSECIRCMAKYTPKRTGVLIESATIHTVIGSGKIIQKTPYARVQYYGNKPGAKKTRRKGLKRKIVRRKKGKQKKTTRNPNTNSLRGRLWFERMKINHGNTILRGARKLAK